jgi:uncharacterized integral membrane protein (TIGR00698 family)
LSLRGLGPGIATAALIALAATFVSERYGGPQFLFALLFGIAFNFLATHPRTRPGIEFTARTVLRFGVGLLGERSSQFTLLTVVGVTALSTLAMILYPAAVPLLGLDAIGAGVFLGGTIHDAAQVVGAGLMISPEVGVSATFVKLLRVAMLVPVVVALSLYFRSRGSPASRARLLPWFLVLFVILVAVNSAGWIPPQAGDAVAELSRWCLVAAIAALGVMTSFGELAALGWQPVILLAAETLFLAAIIVGGLLWFGI